MLVYWKYECFVMQICLCLVCIWRQFFNAAFCMTCSFFLILVEDASGDHMEEAYSRAGLMTAL